MILYGKPIAEQIEQEVRRTISLYPDLRQPQLAIVLVGEHEDSLRYIKRKIKKCNELGIQASLYKFSPESNAQDVIDLITTLNRDTNVDGIILQLPLPAAFIACNMEQLHGDVSRTLIDCIDPDKDIDGLTLVNIAKYTIGDGSGFVPATPRAIMRLLAETRLPLAGKHAVVIGRSLIVGKPVASLLLNKDAAVTLVHAKAGAISPYTKQADVVIAAAGVPHLVREDMVKDGATVIDVGISVNDTGKLVGDVDFLSVSQKAGFISPVPGGVGPLTVAFIIDNLVEAYLRHNGTERIS